jgi:SET domain
MIFVKNLEPSTRKHHKSSFRITTVTMKSPGGVEVLALNSKAFKRRRPVVLYSAVLTLTASLSPIFIHADAQGELPRVDAVRPKVRPNGFYPHPTLVKVEESSLLLQSATNSTHPAVSAEEQSFLHWCRNVLGISASLVEIQYFPYSRSSAHSSIVDWEEDLSTTEKNTAASSEPAETVWVRGLAATRHIHEGEVILRIPVIALFSIPTLLEGDPVLARVLESVVPASEAEDLALLAVVLLHHRGLGSASAMAPYIQMLLRAPVTEDVPFLWSASKLKAQASEGVRIVARSMRQEMQSLYERVILVLVNNHANLFGKTTAIDPVTGEWMFSYEMFQWAFAVVNSRHWQLPPEALPERSVDPDLLPPANTPTQSWLQSGESAGDLLGNTEWPVSFLAPLADLMNFGPPCTRVEFHAETRSFDTIATCPLQQGQEITFWYRNECADVMMGVYGVAHPLIPLCPSGEEWRRQVDTLQEKLQTAYHDIILLEDALETVEALVVWDDEEDGGGESDDGSTHRLRHEAVTGRRPVPHGILRRTGSREF